MHSSPNNPESNQLGKGVTVAQLEAAVTLSGYPLQSVVAQRLIASSFSVTEEWGFLDRATNEHRSLDVFAYRHMLGPDCPDQLCPTVALLVECKRGELPYVFFRAVSPRLPPDFPTVSGLKRRTVSVREPKRSQDVPLARVLGLSDHEFYSTPPICTTLSRPHRKGNGLELSGADTFNSIVLPLVGAVEHWHAHNKVYSENRFWPALSLCVCVIDTPMVVAEGTPEAPVMTLHPWVRLKRQESIADSDGRRRPAYYVVDLVHRSFLGDFIDHELAAFAAFYCERVQKLGPVLAHYQALVANLDSWTWSELKPSV